MATPTKIAFRRVVRGPNGKLMIQFIDANTGAVLSNLDGYTIGSAGGFGISDSPVAAKSADQSTSGGGNSSQTVNPINSNDNAMQPTGTMAGGFLKGLTDPIAKAIGAGAGLVDTANKAMGILDGVHSNKPQQSQPDQGGGFAPAPEEDNGSFEIAHNVIFNPDNIGIRKLPPEPIVVQGLAAIAHATDPNLKFVINSSGQEPLHSPNAKPGVNRTNTDTVNHDIDANGKSHAVDIKVFDANGRQLTPANSPAVFGEIAKNAAAFGFTQIGMGSNITHLGKDPADGSTVRVWSYDANGNWTHGQPDKTIATGIQVGLQLKASGQGVQLYGAALKDIENTQASTRPAPLAPPQPHPDLVKMVDATKNGWGLNGFSAMADLSKVYPTAAPISPVAPETVNPVAPPTVSPVNGAVNVAPRGVEGLTKTGQGAAGTVQMPRDQAPVNPLTGTRNIDATGTPSQSTANPAPTPNQTPPPPPAANTAAPAPAPVSGNQALSAINAIVPPANGGLNEVQMAYLDTINQAEGSPAPDQTFGYHPINDLSQHPNIKVPYNDGKDLTTAAGAYQINYPTWQQYAPKVGVKDFTKQSQDKVAWAIASDNYRAKTGRDLLNDLQSGNPSAVSSAFVNNSNRWSSLPGGKQAQTNVASVVSDFNNNLTKITKPLNAPTDDNMSLVGQDLAAINKSGTSTTNPGLQAALNRTAASFASPPSANSSPSSTPSDTQQNNPYSLTSPSFGGSTFGHNYGSPSVDSGANSPSIGAETGYGWASLPSSNSDMGSSVGTPFDSNFPSSTSSYSQPNQGGGFTSTPSPSPSHSYSQPNQGGGFSSTPTYSQPSQGGGFTAPTDTNHTSGSETGYGWGSFL